VLEVPTTSGSPEPPEPLLSHKPRSRRYTRQQNAISVNIAPMIDMTFMMLIFFLVTRTIQQPEGTLSSRMPTDRGAIAVALPISPVVVRLASSGPESEESTIRIDGFEFAPTDFLQLADALAEIQQKPGFDADTPIVLAADATVRWDHVVNAWNAAVRAEYRNIAFSR
jgi:biopolymer transport protein ExbD